MSEDMCKHGYSAHSPTCGCWDDDHKAVVNELQRELSIQICTASELRGDLDILRSEQMTEERAREVLGDRVSGGDIIYTIWGDGIYLDGSYSPDELEAIAWWMRNKGVEK